MKIRRALGRVKSEAKNVLRNLMKPVAAFPLSRRLLNAWYLTLTPAQKRHFHHEYANIFRESSMHGGKGEWRVVFLGKTIVIPLTRERYWLDWALGVSVVGHEINVKETYEALINSSERPELFVDIGANYGTHSLLFLVHEIKALSFEPNSSCRSYFKQLCEANHVTPNLEPVALGETEGYVELMYPKSDTWLGSTDVEAVKAMGLSQELVTEKVEQKRLDDYFSQIGTRRTLMKMDIEGNEMPVLRAALKILRENRPKIIFESCSDEQRVELLEFFESERYVVCRLPWHPGDKADRLTRAQMTASSTSNFIALPISG